MTTKAPTATGQLQRVRNASHYLSFAIFCVEDQLYCLPKDHLCLQSEVFAGMFSVDNGTDGHSDDHPIVLEGYKSKDFDALLRILVPKPLEPLTPQMKKEEWISVLNLSTIWQMDKVSPSLFAKFFTIQTMFQIRSLAIEKLSNFLLTPLEKITLAREYRVPKWLSEAVTVLASSLNTFKLEDLAHTIGWETTAKIYAVQNAAQKASLDKMTSERDSKPTIPLSRLSCLGCSKAPTSSANVDKGCPCGGRQFRRNNGNSFAPQTITESISGYTIKEKVASPAEFSLVDEGSAATAAVHELFKDEMRAMGGQDMGIQATNPFTRRVNPNQFQHWLGGL